MSTARWTIMTMGWIEVAFLVFVCVPAALTWIGVAFTLMQLWSRSARPLPSTDPGSEPAPGEAQGPRVWADDVLAEEEMETRKTQGAAAHSFDVCTYWDEEDERLATDELAARVRRSNRSP